MTTIKEKTLETRNGSLSYYITEEEDAHHPKNNKLTILFIHELGETKEWLLHQYDRFNLDQYGWFLVPDLFGFGTSSKPREVQAYSMGQQAANLLRLLLMENINISNLVIIAHSMGGPIAVSLVELLVFRSFPGVPRGLLYVEGNLDRNDTFMSSKIAEKTLTEFENGFNGFLERYRKHSDRYSPHYYEKLRASGPFVTWSASRDLVSVSNKGNLLSRIQATKVRTMFVYGERNKGKFTSEQLVQESGFPIYYVPETGHFMHLENPKIFWETMKGILETLQ